MVIIAGHLEVDAGARDQYVTAHEDLVRARQAARCRDLAITADALDPTRVGDLERWQSTERLDARRAVARAPDTGINVRSADVMSHVVSDVRPPFG